MAAHLDTHALRALEAPLFLAEARVVHDIPGRLRLAVAALRGDRARAEAAGMELGRRAAARRVEVNPLTGSIVIEHAPDAAARAAVLRALEGLGCVLVAAPARAPADERGTAALDRATRVAAAAALDWVIERAVLGMLGALA